MELENYDSFPTNLPIAIEDEIFLYPFMIAPIFLAHESDAQSAQFAIENNKLLFVAIAKPGFENKREAGSFYEVGIIGNVMRKVTLPNGKVKLLFQGLSKGRVTNSPSSTPFFGLVEKIENDPYNEDEVVAILEILKDAINKLGKINPKFPVDLVRTIEENNDPYRIADLISSVIRLKKDEAYKLFVENNISIRLLGILEAINKEIEHNKIQKEISQKVNSKIEQVNKNYYIKEQIKALQKELGVDDTRSKELKNYKIKLKELKPFMSENGYKEVKRQLEKLSRMNPESPDASLLQTYVEQVLEIPFGQFSDDAIEISAVQKQLDKDHYSLTKAKDRIVEYFAVKEMLELKKITDSKAKGTVLCFVGPPGVGKTSLANSISQALNRPLIRIALGGVEDVNELRGHRRTYVGAMPGRITLGLIDAKKMNPVIVLDEIDKLGRNHRGDPTAVMLEILDPEQNHAFRDHYLNFSLDLSQAIFVATANDIKPIPSPLRDRMEFIEINSYTPQEKLHIATDYLVPQELKKHGLNKSDISLSKNTIELIIEKYTREAGVRNLRRVFAKIFRKCVKKFLINKELKKISVNSKNIDDFLEKPIFEIDPADKTDLIGIANGLAWTSVGGDVLKIEAIKIKGNGKLSLTGSMGDVMKESAHISYSVVKVLIDSGKLAIDTSKIPMNAKEKEENVKLEPSEIFKRFDIHLHIPEGATPKDGPSAGITMALSLASILSENKIKANIAMTGELTLSSKVLAIGGLKEKLIAAFKAKMKTVLIPRKNFERDLNDVPEEVAQALEIIPVDNIEDVLKFALIQKS